MAIVSMLVGIPGSGKSTLAESIKNKAGEKIRYISTDVIREKHFGNVADMEHNVQVFLIMKNQLVRSLKRGESVILDATFVKRSERRPYISLAKEHGAQVVAYYIKTDLDVALQRNANRERQVPEDVIRFRFDEMEEPDEREGFDEVIIV